MPPKRKVPSSGNNALTYWLNAVDNLRPESAQLNSYCDNLIPDANRWGEAMVNAELDCMADDGRAADHRLRLLRSMGISWYARGYRFWLLPRSADAPSCISGHSHDNKRLTEQASERPGSLRDLAGQAASTWWRKYSTNIIAVATASAAEAERRWAPLPPPRPPPPPRSPAAAPRPPPRLLPSPRPATSPSVSSPITMVTSKATATPLPARLKTLLDSPAERPLSAPRQGIDQQIVTAFRDQQIMRVWNNGTSGDRELTFLDKGSYCLQLDLQGCGLESIFGGGDNRKRDEAALQRVGLGKVNRGGYNSIWGVVRPNQELADALPPEVAAPFAAGKLVLRVPHGTGPWSTREEAIGEATNMLSTALSGCGPRIGALAFSRKLVPDDEAGEEGITVVRYKIYALLECATLSVAARFDPSTTRTASAIESRAYYDALLVAIYQMSNEGYVHLDATLRNFVDFYKLALPASPKTFSVKVIDVELKTFRRLVPDKSAEWRYIFLFNLIMVLTYLKVQLGSSWNPAIHWAPVRRVCAQLVAELSGKSNIAAITMWRGEFLPDSHFPDVSSGIYAGETHQAAAHAALQQLKHYLLQQPLNECTDDYVRVVFAQGQAPERTRAAKAWYEPLPQTTHVYTFLYTSPHLDKGMTVSTEGFFCRPECSFSAHLRTAVHDGDLSTLRLSFSGLRMQSSSGASRTARRRRLSTALSTRVNSYWGWFKNT